MDSIPFLNVNEQQKLYGISCGDHILFEAGQWIPGGEYSKFVHIKNISRRTIRIKYDSPKSKTFSMDFSVWMTLNPGMDKKVNFIFTPLRDEVYDDEIVFHVHVIGDAMKTTSGRFRIPVSARVKTLLMTMPSQVNFGQCAVAEIISKSITLKNNGQIDADYTFIVPTSAELANPFSLEPSQGHLRAGQSADISVCFAPVVASVYTASFICHAIATHGARSGSRNESCELCVLLTALSKYAHLTVSHTNLDFDRVLIGSSRSWEKKFVLQNRSMVGARYRISSVENDQNEVFFLSTREGFVEPGSEKAITVKFIPICSGAYTCNHYDVFTSGGKFLVRLRCRGRAIGPKVSLWTRDRRSDIVAVTSINFKDVPAEGEVSRVLIFKNESAIDAYYHIDAHAKGVFQFTKTIGKLPPLSDTSITITFKAKRNLTGNFYRRVYILLQNHQTLFIDLLATSYNEDCRPSPFEQAHVHAFHWRMRTGFEKLNANQLETMRQERGSTLFYGGAKALNQLLQEGKPLDCHDKIIQIRYHQINAEKVTATASGDATLAEIRTSYEYFECYTSRTIPIDVRIQDKAVEGAHYKHTDSCIFANANDTRLLTVSNNTQGKVVCVWHIAYLTRRDSDNAHSENPVFTVAPSSAEIEAGGMHSFVVSFHPQNSSTMYMSELEGYISFKANRSFRFVDFESLQPPWFIPIKVYGHEFASICALPSVNFHIPKTNDNDAKDTYTTTFTTSDQKIHFPPCSLCDSVFQTVLVSNDSDIAVIYQIDMTTSDCFDCKPDCGYIAPRSYHLMQFKFTPKKVGAISSLVYCIVNGIDDGCQALELIGIGAIPDIRLHKWEADLGQDPHTPDNTIVVNNEVEFQVSIRPTAPDLTSVRSIRLSNTSRIPLVYGFEIPQLVGSVYSMHPEVGHLYGCDSVQVDCTFSPQAEQRKYNDRLTLIVKPVIFPWYVWNQSMIDDITNVASFKEDPSPLTQKYGIRIISESSSGAISFDPTEIQFEATHLFARAKKVFYLINSADCVVSFDLFQKGFFKHANCSFNFAGMEEHVNKMIPSKTILSFSVSQGSIPARSRKKIVAKFVPIEAGYFVFDVYCILGGRLSISQKSELSSCSFIGNEDTGMKVAKCSITAQGSFPTILINDVQAAEAPPPLLWQQSSATAFNAYMSQCYFEPEHERQNVAIGLDGTESSRCRKFDFHFTPAPLLSAKQHVYVQIYNPGPLAADCHIQFPEENDVEMEHWVSDVTLSDAASQSLATLDSKVFDISPRSFTLSPKKSIVLSLTYSYHWDGFIGFHRLPVLLEIDKGNKIIWILKGQTILNNQPKLWVPQCDKVQLSPMMVGEYRQNLKRDGESITGFPGTSAPVQQFKVYNVGNSALNLDVDCSSMDKINCAALKGSVFHIFQCVRVPKMIKAKSYEVIEVVFNPIIVQSYEVKLVLHATSELDDAKAETTRRPLSKRSIRRNMTNVEHATPYQETCIVNLIGIGYHPYHTDFVKLSKELLFPRPSSNSISCLASDLDSNELPEVFMAQDHLDFGHVPLFSHTSRILVLHNRSKSNTFHFRWNTTHQYIRNNWLRFSPAEGIAGPGDSLMIKVDLDILSDISILNDEIPCFFTLSSAIDTSAASHSQLRRGPVSIGKQHVSVVSRPTQSTEAQASTPTTIAPCFDKRLSSLDQPRLSNQSQKLQTSLMQIFVKVHAHPLPLEPAKKLVSEEFAPTSFMKNPKASWPNGVLETLDECHPQYSPICIETAIDILEVLISSTLQLQDVQDCVATRKGSFYPTEISCNSGADLAIPPRDSLPLKTLEMEWVSCNVLETLVCDVLQELLTSNSENDRDAIPAQVPKANYSELTSLPYFSASSQRGANA